MKLGLFVFILLTAFSAIATDFSPKKIIGDDDSIVVDADAGNIPRPMSALVDAFGWSNSRCTMTHIGGGYVLTAGHCFDAKKELLKDLDCKEVQIKWGLRQGTSPYLESQCEKIVAMQNDRRIDFALIKVSPIPRAAAEPDLEIIPDGLKVTLFSHPRGLPLRWAQYCAIEANPYSSEKDTAIFNHQCDTEGGSSGAALIDAASLKVVGIHNGRILESNYGTHVNQEPLRRILKDLLF